MQKVKEAGGSDEAILSLLQQTNQEWEQHLEVESEEAKASCVSTLLEVLRTSENKEVHGHTLRALRLLCREASALRPLAEEEVGTLYSSPWIRTVSLTPSLMLTEFAITRGAYLSLALAGHASVCGQRGLSLSRECHHPARQIGSALDGMPAAPAHH